MGLTQTQLMQLLRKLAHDLRGPLINLRMGLEVALALDEAQERENLGQEITRELVRLDGLVNLTTEFAQAIEMQAVDVSLTSVLAQFVANLEIPSGIAFESSLSSDVVARVDVDRVLRVLGYHFQESLQRMGGNGRVLLCLACGDEGWEIRLEDSGPAAEVAFSGKIDLVSAYCRLVAEGHGGELLYGVSPALGGRMMTFRVAPPAVTIEPQQLRRVLGHYATGVTVVSSADEGTLRGMTVNSFTSVSLSPPLVLYCSTPGATLEAVRRSRHFAVNILSQEQLELARRFAGQTPIKEGDRFADVSYTLGAECGCPLLSASLAQLECRVTQMIPSGDHDIVIGQVLALHTEAVKSPLLFFRGKFPDTALG